MCSAASSCQQMLGHMDLSGCPERSPIQKNTPHLPLLSVLSHVFDICFPFFCPDSPPLPPGSFRAGWVPKSRESGGRGSASACNICHYAVWVYKAEPAGMCVHACACHIWHSTPSQSVFLCPPGRISPLKYSGGCRNALYNAGTLQSSVLCIYEAEPSRFEKTTDLPTTCW